MGESLDAWFAREILVNEMPLVRYLMRTWPPKDEVHDLTGDLSSEAAGKERPRSAKAFLFATARHLLVDRMRRNRVVTFEPGWDLKEQNVLVDEVSPERSAGADEEIRALAQALDNLPPRCREVVWMRRIEQKPEPPPRAGAHRDALALEWLACAHLCLMITGRAVVAALHIHSRHSSGHPPLTVLLSEEKVRRHVNYET